MAPATWKERFTGHSVFRNIAHINAVSLTECLFTSRILPVVITLCTEDYQSIEIIICLLLLKLSTQSANFLKFLRSPCIFRWINNIKFRLYSL